MATAADDVLARGQGLPGQSGQILADDGVPLKVKLARTTRRIRLRAFLLTLPLLLFLLVTFVIPIGQMLWRSAHNPTLTNVLPNFATAIQSWDETASEYPDESVFEIFVSDMKAAAKNKEVGRTIGNVAVRNNYEMPGTASLFKSTGRKVKNLEEGPYKEALFEINKKWENPAIWKTLKRISNDYSPAFYVAALDRTYDENGKIVQKPEKLQIYVDIFWRTLWLSALITAICLLLAYPISFLLSILPLKTSNLLMIMVLLPFWTSLLVRTTAWIAILQSNGVINNILVWAHLIPDDARPQMIYNQTGTIIAMVHILLPFMVLPLFSVMKTIPPSYMRAARSMGGTWAYSFRKIYLPQTLPGVAAGTLLVFILAIGYYITPALVGGQDGLLISNLIAFHMQKSSNWSLAAALGTLLLAVVLLLYWLYNKFVGVDNLKFG